VASLPCLEQLAIADHHRFIVDVNGAIVEKRLITNTLLATLTRTPGPDSPGLSNSRHRESQSTETSYV
jgi:hypothetical protein